MATTQTVIELDDYPGGFQVVGTQLYGRRFSNHYPVESARIAFNINLWRGKVYGIKKDGRRVLLKTVIN